MAANEAPVLLKVRIRSGEFTVVVLIQYVHKTSRVFLMCG